ncbi:unnamed protein product [Ectocarpus sp. 12 AP-2014]
MSMADQDEATAAVVEGLKRLYHTKLKPLEQTYMFGWFHSPPLTDSEFESKPQVLMCGQYSTGKTSFIRYLLGRDFPGQRIGPEPTTDRFVAVMDGSDERVVPGNALTVSPNLPYRGLDRFGVSFLNKFEASQLPSPVLRNITIVDTPGVLSGEKQRVSRGYDFVNVCHWFAERADLILLLFDAHKLDISDEFKAVIERLKGQDDKIRVILNKADQVDRQKLMRVYGALMWSMGKIIRTPEVLRVYVGSFWDEPLMYDDNAALFDMEERDLMNDLRELPRNSAVRKINELVKRCRLAKVHAYIIGYLRAQMPSMMGKEKVQKQLTADLAQVFRAVMKQHNLAPGDFPDLEPFRSKLADTNFTKFPKLKVKMLEELDEMLSVDIPRLMEMLPRTVAPTRADEQIRNFMQESNDTPTPPKYNAPGGASRGGGGGGGGYYEQQEGDQRWAGGASGGGSYGGSPPEPTGVANPFKGPPQDSNPFGDEPSASGWALEVEAAELRGLFEEYEPVAGKLSAVNARAPLVQSGLPNDTLRVIWDLSDMDNDGMLDLEEFTVAMHLCDRTKAGEPLPDGLPRNMVPPSKASLMF